MDAPELSALERSLATGAEPSTVGGAPLPVYSGIPVLGQLPSTVRDPLGMCMAAMKRHGLVLADNGSPWYFQGAQSRKWPVGLLDELKSIPASAFEAVDTSSLQVAADSGAVRTP